LGEPIDNPFHVLHIWAIHDVFEKAIESLELEEYTQKEGFNKQNANLA
jgi:hypothetical protein